MDSRGTGIAPEADAGDLQKPFWRRFTVDEAWLSAFSRYDPQAGENYAEQEEGLAGRLSDFFGAEVDSDARLDNAGEIAWSSASAMAADFLRCTPESVLTCLNTRLEDDDCLDDQLYVRTADDLYAHRDPKLYDVFASSRLTTAVRSEFVFHTKRRDIELTGRPAASGELETMADFLLALQEEKSAERLNVQFILLLLRLSEHRMLKDFYNRIGGLSLDPPACQSSDCTRTVVASESGQTERDRTGSDRTVRRIDQVHALEASAPECTVLSI